MMRSRHALRPRFGPKPRTTGKILGRTAPAHVVLPKEEMIGPITRTTKKPKPAPAARKFYSVPANKTVTRALSLGGENRWVTTPKEKARLKGAVEAYNAYLKDKPNNKSPYKRSKNRTRRASTMRRQRLDW